MKAHGKMRNAAAWATFRAKKSSVFTWRLGEELVLVNGKRLGNVSKVKLDPSHHTTSLVVHLRARETASQRRVVVGCLDTDKLLLGGADKTAESDRQYTKWKT